MHQGIYIAASGALNSMYRQDVAANNLANISTPAFKPDQVLVRQRDAVRQEDNLGHLSSSDLLEILGGGVHGQRTHTSYSQGAITTTGNPLDIAIRGDGFFVVRAGKDETGDTLRLTRDGRFTLGPEGLLVNQQGMPVLDTSRDEIKLTAGVPVTIDTDGTIRQNGAEVAQLAVLDVPDPQQLRKHGASLFAAPTNTVNGADQASASIEQFAVEASGVNPVSAIMSVTSAGRAVESNIGMISRYDTLLDRAVNTFARVG